MSEPTIKDFVPNLHKNKYVCPFDYKPQTPYGRLQVPQGWLSDGASCVLDLQKEAFMAHDYLYVYPYIEGKRLTKFQCDRVYASLLWRNKRWFFAGTRILGLTLGGFVAWSSHRKEEEEDPEGWTDRHFVPMIESWDYSIAMSSWRTKDLIWVGAI